MSNPNHDELGRFSEGPGGAGTGDKTTDNAIRSGVTWAQQFNEFSVTSAFGPSTVNAAALRAHMHANNPDVQQAAARVHAAEAAVNVFRFADPRAGFQPTPSHLESNLTSAKSDLRRVEKFARRSVGR